MVKSIKNQISDIMKQAGAKTVRACASHCVMSGPASERVQDSALEEIAVSYTHLILQKSERSVLPSKTKVL